MTAVVSAVDTVTVITYTTATVATTTLLFTESTTTTASTATSIALQTTTVLVTSTDVQTAPPIIISTTTVYDPGTPTFKKMARDGEVMARGNNPWDIPDYAWPACQDWGHYVDACKCFGIIPSTTTAHATTTTITVTAPNAITTTVSTLTTTKTNTVPVTATTLATFTAVVQVIASVTTNQTVTETSTAVVTTTTTPTVTATQFCKATGVPFRITAEIVGEKYYLVNVGATVWRNLGANADTPANLAISAFVLDSNAFLERASPNDNVVEYIDVQNPSASESIFPGDKTTIEAGAPWTMRIKGCIDPTTNILGLEADGRSNILECNISPVLSTGDGTDAAAGCTRVFPLAEALPV